MSILLDDAKFGAFVAREAYKVFFFEVFDRFLVSIADVGLFLSWFRFSECGMELMVDYSELVFPSNRTQNGYTSKSRSSLTDWIAKSQDPPEEKTSQYASLTNPTL